MSMVDREDDDPILAELHEMVVERQRQDAPSAGAIPRGPTPSPTAPSSRPAAPAADDYDAPGAFGSLGKSPDDAALDGLVESAKRRKQLIDDDARKQARNESVKGAVWGAVETAAGPPPPPVQVHDIDDATREVALRRFGPDTYVGAILRDDFSGLGPVKRGWMTLGKYVGESIPRSIQTGAEVLGEKSGPIEGIIDTIGEAANRWAFGRSTSVGDGTKALDDSKAPPSYVPPAHPDTWWGAATGAVGRTAKSIADPVEEFYKRDDVKRRRPTLGSIRKEHWIDDAVEFFLESTGEGAASTVLMLGASLAGGRVGGGAMLGALSTAEIRESFDEAKVDWRQNKDAMLAAVAAHASLEHIPGLKEIRNALSGQTRVAFEKAVLTAAIKGAAKGGTKEGVTEGLQTAVELAAPVYAESRELGAALGRVWTDVLQGVDSKVVNAAVQGAISGSQFTAGSAAAETKMRNDAERAKKAAEASPATPEAPAATPATSDMRAAAAMQDGDGERARVRPRRTARSDATADLEKYRQVIEGSRAAPEAAGEPAGGEAARPAPGAATAQEASQRPAEGQQSATDRRDAVRDVGQAPAEPRVSDEDAANAAQESRELRGELGRLLGQESMWEEQARGGPDVSRAEVQQARAELVKNRARQNEITARLDDIRAQDNALADAEEAAAAEAGSAPRAEPPPRAAATQPEPTPPGAPQEAPGSVSGAPAPAADPASSMIATMVTADRAGQDGNAVLRQRLDGLPDEAVRRLADEQLNLRTQKAGAALRDDVVRAARSRRDNRMAAADEKPVQSEERDAGAVTDAMRTAFARALASPNAARRTWGKAIGATPEQVATLTEEAVADGRLRKTSGGQLVRTAKAKAAPATGQESGGVFQQPAETAAKEPDKESATADRAPPTLSGTDGRAAVPAIDRKTEVRLDAAKSPVTRRYAQQLAEAASPEAVAPIVEAMKADRKATQAVLNEMLGVLTGTPGKGRAKAKTIAQIAEAAAARVAARPAPPVTTVDPSGQSSILPQVADRETIVNLIGQALGTAAPAQMDPMLIGRGAARAEVLEFGARTGREHGVMVLADGSTKANQTSAANTDRFLDVTPETAPELWSASPRSVDLHHNHPRSTSHSRSDYTAAASRPGLRRSWVHGHDGSEYWAEFNADPETLGRAYDIAHAATAAAAKVKGFARYATHVRAMLMRDAGVIEYGYTLAPEDAARIIVAMRERIGSGWDRAVSEIIGITGGWQHVLDRRSGDRRDRGVEGVPGAAAGSATAGQPGSAVVDAERAQGDREDREGDGGAGGGGRGSRDGFREDVEDDFPRVNKDGFVLALPYEATWGNPRFVEADRARAIARLREIQHIDADSAPWADLVQARRDIDEIVSSLFYYAPDLIAERAKDGIPLSSADIWQYMEEVSGFGQYDGHRSLFSSREVPADIQEFSEEGGQALDTLLESRRKGLHDLLMYGDDLLMYGDPGFRRVREPKVLDPSAKMPSGFYFKAGRKVAEARETLFQMSGQAVINWMMKEGVSRAEIDHFRLQEKFGDKLGVSVKASREDFQEAIAARMFDFRRKVSWLNPERSRNDYELGGTRAFRGPRIPGRGIYFEAPMAFPKRLQGGEKWAPGYFRSPHWEDVHKGTWASRRGSIRDVPGWGRMMIDEEAQTDFMQGASTGRRPRMSTAEIAAADADSRRKKEFDRVSNRAIDLAKTAVGWHASAAASDAQDDFVGKVAPGRNRSMMARSADEWLAAVANERSVIEIYDRDDAVRRERALDALVALRDEHPDFFTADAWSRFYSSFEDKLNGRTPETPIDASYVRTMARDLLLLAAGKGVDSVAIATSDTTARIQNNPKAAHFYDAQLKPALERELRTITGNHTLVLEEVALPKAMGAPKREKPYTVWAAKLPPETSLKIKADGLPMMAILPRNGKVAAMRESAEAKAKRLAAQGLRMGRTVKIPDAVQAEMRDAMRQAPDILPVGAVAGFVTAFEPMPAYKGEPMARATVETADGSTISIPGRAVDLLGARALFLPLKGVPHVVHVRLAGLGEQGTDAIASERWHEAIHALKASGVIVGRDWNLLRAHAHELRILELPTGDYQRVTGDSTPDTSGITILEDYHRAYSPVMDAAQLRSALDEEAVAIMVELATRGVDMQLPADVKAILARIETGEMQRAAAEAKDAARQQDVAIAMATDGRQMAPEQKATLADHFGATRVEDIGPDDPHPGRVLAFHGTDVDFAGGRFDVQYSSDFGIHFGTPEHANRRSVPGSSLDIADNGGRVIPVVIDAQNAIDLPDLASWQALDVAREVERLRPDMAGLASRIAAAADNHTNPVEASDDLLRGELTRAGINAIRYRNATEGYGWSYIVWEPGHVVSATSGGMLFALGQQPTEAQADAATGQSMRRVLDQLGYYSKALEAARGLKQAKGTPEQMLAQLKKAGVKDGEIEATRLRSAIDGKKSATRDEIVKHLENNRVGLKEAFYGGPNTFERMGSDEAERVTPRWMQSFGDLVDRLPDAIADPIHGLVSPMMERSVRARIDRLTPAGRTGPAKWSSYSLDPLNPTYRETVIHLPAPLLDRYRALTARLNQIDRTPGGVSTPEYAALRDEINTLSLNREVFQSGHFPQSNIVGHMMTSMTTHEGRPVYTIDQIQSDWGQKLRDGGMRDEAKIAAADNAMRDAKQRLHDTWDAGVTYARERGYHLGGLEKKPNPLLRQSRFRLAELIGGAQPDLKKQIEDASHDYALRVAEYKTATAAAPGHPLVNTTDQWTNTTLRRAIRQAAEAGAEFIAIPSGDTVMSYNRGDANGMRGFYGSTTSEGIVPKNLRKLLSALDKATPAPEKIETLDSPSGKVGLGKGFTLFRLTDAARAAVMEEGQPLFSLMPRAAAHPGSLESYRPGFADGRIVGGGINARLTSAAAAQQTEIEQSIEAATASVITRITGQDAVDVKFLSEIRADDALTDDQRRSLGMSDLPRTAGGTYRRPTLDAKAVITLALNDPLYDPITTAGHEAYHHVEEVLATPAEMTLLRAPSTMARATRLAAAEIGRSVEDIAKLPDYEIRAIAFQRYRRQKEEGAGEVDAPPSRGIRAFWNRLLRMFDAVVNGLSGLGFTSLDAIFERARTGEMARRDDLSQDAGAQEVGAVQNADDLLGGLDALGREGGVARRLRGEPRQQGDGSAATQVGGAAAGRPARGGRSDREGVADPLAAGAGVAADRIGIGGGAVDRHDPNWIDRVVGLDFASPETKDAARQAGWNVDTPFYTGSPKAGYSRIDQARFNPSALRGPGVYMTDDPHVAGGKPGDPNYSEFGYTVSYDAPSIEQSPSPGVYKLVHRVKKPFDTDRQEIPIAWLPPQYHGLGRPGETFDYDRLAILIGSPARGKGRRTQYVEPRSAQEIINQAIEAQGYDGITHVGGGRAKGGSAQHRVMVAFHPQQVRSITAEFADATQDAVQEKGTPDHGQMASFFGRRPANAASATPDTGKNASLNRVIQTIISALGMTPTQTLMGVTIKGTNAAGQTSSVRINPRATVRGQTMAATGAVGIRRSRDIEAIAHEGAHYLETTMGAPILDLQQRHLPELEYNYTSPGKPFVKSEGFAEFFRNYILNPDATRKATPELVEDFEDAIEVHDPDMLAGLHDAQKLYQDWRARATPDELAGDLVSYTDRNAISELRADADFAPHNARRWAATAYTWGSDRLSPIASFFEKLVRLGDKNGNRDANGRPLSTALHERSYELARMLPGAYTWARSMLTDGIGDLAGGPVRFPSLTDAMETLFGSRNRSDWRAGGRREFRARDVLDPEALKDSITGARRAGPMYKVAGQYLVSVAAVERWNRYEAREERLEEIDRLLALGGEKWRQDTNAQRENRDILERRETALVRAETLLSDRRRALGVAERAATRLQEQIRAKKDAILGAQMGRDAALAARHQRELSFLERQSRQAVDEVSGLIEEFDTLETEVAILDAEIEQRRAKADSIGSELRTLGENMDELRKERTKTEKRTASRPPTKESKEWHEDFIEKVKADPRFAKIEEFAKSYRQFMLGLQTLLLQAGILSQEEFDARAKNAEWYAPMWRDMSDINDDSGLGGLFKKSGMPPISAFFKRFDGSDRAIVNPIEVAAQMAYMVAKKIRHNEAGVAMVTMANAAGEGAADILQVLTTRELMDAGPAVFDQIEETAIGLGIDPQDAADLRLSMEQNYEDGAQLEAMWTPGTQGPLRGGPTMPVYIDGERVMVVFKDKEFGIDAYQAFTMLGADLRSWLSKLLAKPAQILTLGITSHPTFALALNLVRDVPTAWVMAGGTPLVTQVRGVMKLYDKEFMRKYQQVGGLASGRNFQALPLPEQQAKVIDLADEKFSLLSTAIGGWWGATTAIGAGAALGVTGLPLAAGAIVGGLALGSLLSRSDNRQVADSVESMTRVGVAAKIYDEVRQSNPSLTDLEAMFHAAYQARVLLDWNLRGSKMLTWIRWTAFLNSQIRGLDQGARLLAASNTPRGAVKGASGPAISLGMAGMAGGLAVAGPLGAAVGGTVALTAGIARGLRIVHRHQNSLELSAEELADLSNSYKVAFRWAALTAVSVSMWALATHGGDDDDEKQLIYDDIKDKSKSVRWWFPGFFGKNGDLKAAKAFEWALPGNYVEIVADGITGRDPRVWQRIADSTYEVLAPPAVFDWAKVASGLMFNTRLDESPVGIRRAIGGSDQNEAQRKLVGERESDLDPEDQFNAYTSALSKDLSAAIAILTRHNGTISPIKLDFLLRAGTGMWSSDITGSYRDFRENVVGMPPGPAKRLSEYPIIGGFVGHAARQSKSVDEFTLQMARHGGRFIEAANTYKSRLQQAPGNWAHAEAHLSRIDNDARAYALLKYHGSPQEIKDHPFERAVVIDQAIMKMKRLIIEDKVAPVVKENGHNRIDWARKVELNPNQKTELIDTFERLRRAEMHNTLVVMQREGWQGKKLFNAEKTLDTLKEQSPETATLYRELIKNAATFAEVERRWPEKQRRILDDPERALGFRRR